MPSSKRSSQPSKTRTPKQLAASSEAWTRHLTEVECSRRGWETYDPTFYGYKSKRERFPRRYDLFGFVDLLAVGPQGKLYGIQFTSNANMAARVKKAAGHENLAFVRKAGIEILVWGWRVKGSEPVLREAVV